MKPEPQVVREHNRTRRSRTKTDGECRLQGKAAQERLKGGSLRANAKQTGLDPEGPWELNS